MPIRRDVLSQGLIKNSDFRGGLRTVESVIDSRQPNPAHIRDLLLLAATAANSEGAVDTAIVTDLDVVDVVAVTATMVSGQLHALTAAVASAQHREQLAGGVLAGAAAMVPDPRAVNAVATVVGASTQGDVATGAAIARCLSAFAPHELIEASIALVTASIAALAASAGVGVNDVVAWSAGEPGDRRPALRPARAPYCNRGTADELHLHHHSR